MRSAFARVVLTGVSVAILCVAAPVAADSEGEMPQTEARRPRRVVILSVRDASWAELARSDVANLTEFLGGASLGSMSLHGARRGRPTAADMFVTLSAGTRSDTGDRNHDGNCRVATSQTITCVGAGEIVNRNAAGLYGAEPFILGAMLSENGIERRFVGDCIEDCSAALALVDEEGALAFGGADLEDVLRNESVDDRSSVVFADFANLTRLNGALSVVSRSYLAAADLVVLISPTTSGGAPSLSAFAMQGAPNGHHFVSSPTTRRDGIVQMIDVAPTVLDALSIDPPASIEGRVVTDSSSFRSFGDAIDELRAVNRESRLRDRMIGGGVAALATLEILIVALLMLLVVCRRAFPNQRLLHRRAFDTTMMHVAVVACSYVPATLVVNLFPLDRGGHWTFWPTMGVTTFCLAAVSWLPIAGRSRPLVVVVSITAAILLIDGVTGTHLSFNSIFGFSATGGDRFAGYGNSTAAFLCTSCFVASIGIVRRSVATAGLGIVALVVAAPPFGADIGGAVTMAAALAAFILVRSRTKLLSRASLAVMGAMTVVAGAIGYVDSMRSAGSQTHLGRFIDAIGTQGSDEFSRVVHRKWIAAQHELLHSVATFTVPSVLVLMATVWCCLSESSRRYLLNGSERRAAAVAIAIVAVLGSLINDSGINVAMASFGVAVPAYVWAIANHTAANPPRAKLAELVQ